MLATAQSCAVVGLEGYIDQVEVETSPNLPTYVTYLNQVWQTSLSESLRLIPPPGFPVLPG